MALFPAPGKGNPMTRLVALCATLCMVLAGMYSCYYKGGGIGYVPPADEQEMIVADEGCTVDDPLPGVYGSKTLQRYNILDFVSSDDKRPTRSADLSRIRPALTEGFNWLKHQPYESLRKQAWRRGRWSHSKIMRDVDRWRLEVLHVYGMLLHAETLELDGMPVGLRKVYKLILIDVRNNQSYTILTPLMPKDAKPVRPNKNGSYLACDGLFLMRYPYFAEGGIRRTPLILAKRVYRASEAASVSARLDIRGDPGVEYKELAPPEAIGRLDLPFVEKNLYSPPKDGEGFRYPGAIDYRLAASNLKEDKPALDHMFAYLYGLSDEAIRLQVNPEVGYIPLMRENRPPRWMVGKVTHVSGLAGTVQTHTFSNDPDGLTRIHLIVVHDMSLGGPEFTWILAALNLPPDLHENDRVEAEGLFVKLFPYKTPEGKWHWSPMVVCKSIRRIPPVPASAVTNTHILIGGTAILLLLILFWASNRDTAKLGDIRQRVLERRIAHDKKMAEKRKAVKQEAASTGAEAGASESGAPSGSDASGSGDGTNAPESGEADTGEVSPPEAG